ncbi:MAG: TRAP transporter fused permease subunit [Pseudomonadota bacterium]|nr:TRAP transporter fused permease subunit [Pseudomonadota bacterium]
MTEQSHRWIWVGLGAASITFHIWLIFSGLVPSLVSRPLHMALALPWVFVFAAQGTARRWLGLCLTIVGSLFCGFIALNESALSDQYGFITGGWQITVGVGLILLTLEMARRAVSWPLPLITFLFLLYGLFGSHIPGEFGHPGLPFNSFLGTLVITEGGLWGKLTGVSVSVVAVFVIFGAILNAGEAGQGFMNIAIAAAGRLKGGAAKVSVLSSALFGSISGSASANVASTGMVTLPSMRRLGYPKRIAAAVEAVASTGGQIMPPLMGAGAFVMVELTGIPYTQIIIAAALPAILYFATVWIGVNGYADRHGLKPYREDMRPALRAVVVTSLFFAVPFAALLIVMFSGYTPQFAAACAIIIAALLLLTGADLTFNPARARDRIMQAAITAGRQIAMIASIILCASIIVGILGMTGLGVKITSGILAFSGDSLWLALALTALACIILGMEVPTTAAYVICVSVAGPALIDMGVAPLLVHLFIFWYALLSTITPPVCGGVFIAASMVEENWLPVAGSAMSLGLGLYVIPLAIIRHPELTGLADAPLAALLTALQIGVGLAFLGRGLTAPHAAAVRAALVAAGLAVIFLRFDMLAAAA